MQKSFFQAYIERTNKRYPKAKQVIDEKNPAIITYDSDEGVLFIERRGQEVISIEGGTEPQLKTLKEAVWKGFTKINSNTKELKKTVAKR